MSHEGFLPLPFGLLAPAAPVPPLRATAAAAALSLASWHGQTDKGKQAESQRLASCLSLALFSTRDARPRLFFQNWRSSILTISITLTIYFAMT